MNLSPVLRKNREFNGVIMTNFQEYAHHFQKGQNEKKKQLVKNFQIGTFEDAQLARDLNL